ncbi:MAG: Gfo/Idh/MocA family oxidoreductase, partial [Pirellulaceae bacterium]
MSDSNRRQFLKSTSAGLAGSVAVASAPAVRAANAVNEVVVGLVGHGGRGRHVASLFASQENVRIGWVADANKHRLQAAAQGFNGQRPKLTDDMRKIYDDPAVDAVIVATPDHWHTPAAILACDAGKHVYVEKPCSHNIREGRLLVEAARRNKRLVQHGTQVRSTQM